MHITISLVVPPGPVQVRIKFVSTVCDIVILPLVGLGPANAPPEPLHEVAPGTFQVNVIVSPGFIISVPEPPPLFRVVVGGGGALT